MDALTWAQSYMNVNNAVNDTGHLFKKHTFPVVGKVMNQNRLYCPCLCDMKFEILLIYKQQNKYIRHWRQQNSNMYVHYKNNSDNELGMLVQKDVWLSGSYKFSCIYILNCHTIAF